MYVPPLHAKFSARKQALLDILDNLRFHFDPSLLFSKCFRKCGSCYFRKHFQSNKEKLSRGTISSMRTNAHAYKVDLESHAQFAKVCCERESCEKSKQGVRGACPACSPASSLLSSKFDVSNLLESKLSSKFETSNLLESLLETIPFSTQI